MLTLKHDGNDRIKIIFLCGIVLLVILSIMSYIRMNQLRIESLRATHTLELTIELHRLSACIQEAESSQRGYVLTKDSQFLSKVNTARSQINQGLKTIDSLTKRNLKQKRNLILLKAAVYQKLDYLQIIVTQATVSILKDNQFLKGKALMDTVNMHLGAMIQEENRLMQLRTNSLTKLSIQTPQYYIILILSAILILIASYYKIIQELHKTEQFKYRIEESKTELEKSYVLLQSKTEEIDKRESELVIANRELVFQNHEKEKRASELEIINQDLNLSERQLKESFNDLSKYQDAFDETSIIAITDQNGIIRKANANFCKISKYNEQELIGQDHRMINSGYHSKEYIKQMWQTISIGKIWKGELKNRAKDGSFYWVDTTIVPFLNDQGKPYQYLAIRVDITNRKESVEKLESAYKELESFNYISSHDLQVPLRHIQNFASRILDDESQNLTEKGKFYFEKINSSALRMQNLLKDLLIYSQTSIEERTFERTNLNHIIMNILNELSVLIDEKHAKIVLGNLGSDVNVIPFQIEQLLYNLLGNALNFAKPDIPSLIKIDRSNVLVKDIKDVALLPNISYCHISITDNGIGFNPQYNNRIFGLFQRLDHDQKVAGTGIGLAIVKKIVENHHGFITAKGELNVGARFDIYIPV
jgi:PAS domain S-box-containing protein